MPAQQPDEVFTLTTVLEQLSPFWSWVRANFSLPSVLTIAGVIVSALLWITNLKTRVIVLEHEVVHITRIVPDTASIAGLKQQVSDHEERIHRLEDDWDTARNFEQLPPRPMTARRRK